MNKRNPVIEKLIHLHEKEYKIEKVIMSADEDLEGLSEELENLRNEIRNYLDEAVSRGLGNSKMVIEGYKKYFGKELF